MNDLEMYREQLALCDDKIIDALVERNFIIEKIMAYKEEYGMPILQPHQEEKQKINIKKKSLMCLDVSCVTVRESRQENSLIITLY